MATLVTSLLSSSKGFPSDAQKLSTKLSHRTGKTFSTWELHSARTCFLSNFSPFSARTGEGTERTSAKILQDHHRQRSIFILANWDGNNHGVFILAQKHARPFEPRIHWQAQRLS